jgi:AcrR family transcriptional regulator
MSVAEDRPLRSDARRNREAILKAARAVLGSQGTCAQMDDIARRAKVGVGTVYRHFPTKDALIRALVDDRVDQIVVFWREGLENPDPWEGFVSALWRGAELGSRDRALSQVFAEDPGQAAEAHAGHAELPVVMGQLIARAQEAGVLRADVRGEDISMLMCGVMQALHHMSSGPVPDVWQRHLRVILDGLRAPAATEPLPG